MSKITYGFKEKNIELLKRAESIARKLSVDLRSFYENQVDFKDEFSDIKKVAYDELCVADSSAANNGFSGMVKTLEGAAKLVDDHYDGDVNAWVKDEEEIDKETGTEGGMNLVLSCVGYDFKHICKWIQQEEFESKKK